MTQPAQTWANGLAGGTPLSATRLNNMEGRITAVGDRQYINAMVAGLVEDGASDTYQSIAALATRSDLVVNVLDGGAAGDGVTDDTADVQAALAGGGRIVYFPAGGYRITAPLRVQARTWVLLHPAAVLYNDSTTHENVFLNGPVGDTAYATGYAGDGDLRFTGGTIDLGPRAARSQTCEAIGIGHATNVLIENMTFRNGYSSHLMEINSSRNVTVRNCVFADQASGGAADREAINIDSATSAGFPQFGAYDATVCEDVLIEGCRFVNVPDGIGTHASTDNAHRNIRIRDCVFVGVERAVRARGWVGGFMTACRVENAQTNAVYVQDCIGLRVERNHLENAGIVGNGLHSAVLLAGGSGCVAADNRIASSHANKHRVAYDVDSGSGHSIATAGATAGSAGFVVEDSGTLTVIDGATSMTIADDAFVALPMPGTNSQGLAHISMQSTATYAPRGLFWIRVGVGPAVTPVAQIAAADLVLTTNIKTVATATDAKFTVSAGDDGLLYFINRAGLGRRLSISFPATS